MQYPRNTLKNNKDEKKAQEIKRRLREYLYETQDGQCGICYEWFPDGTMVLDWDLESTMGGDDELDNYQIVCRRCKRDKMEASPKTTKINFNRSKNP